MLGYPSYTFVWEVDIGNIGEELGQMATEVKIAFTMSYGILSVHAKDVR